jgi:hypothetical protein
MQERPAPGSPPDAIQNASTPGPLGDSFLSAKRYPGEVAARPSAPEPPAPAPPRRVFTRVVLPLLIFIGAIGVLAWVTQYLPSRSVGPTQVVAPDGGEAKRSGKVLTFWTQVALWEPQNKKAAQPDEDKQLREQKVIPYGAEYEVSTDTRHDDGHYDFVFENRNDEPLALGVEKQGCQCASISACVLAGPDWARYQKFVGQADPVTRSRQSTEDGFAWRPLVERELKGLTVPPRTHGVLRVFWLGTGRREAEKVFIKPEIWVSPPGQYDARNRGMLLVPTAYVRPAMFTTDRISIGNLGPQTESLSGVFHCWSATRDLQVRVRETDPCFATQVTRLGEEECRQLTETLRHQGTMTRVRSAYQVQVTVHEQKDGKQLDLGTFIHPVGLEVKGNNEDLRPLLPTVRGRVLGDVKVGALEEERGINLKYFKGPQGTTVKTTMWAKKGVELEYEGFGPPILKLKVDLRKQDKEDLPGWVGWEVRVTVPPGLDPGPLPEDSALILRTKGKGRRVRIPLIGSVGRG